MPFLRYSLTDPERVSRHKSVKRSFPLLGLLLYYAVAIGVAAALVSYVPGFRQALVAPIDQPPPAQLDGLLSGRQPAPIRTAAPWDGIFGRGLLALVAMAWALTVALPVAWVLMRTRRLRYDPSLVHTIIVLPIVVAGVVLVVKNSLALAFALAGIVAGVRFRQKLEQPEEAVYVLLALGIGLAAGVQALDVALVMSMAFTTIVLAVWRYDIGAIHEKGRGAQLRMGDATLLPRSGHAAAREIVARQAADGGTNGLKPDGLLVVHAENRETALIAIETVASRLASEWRVAEPHTGNGIARIETLMRLKTDADPAQVVAELEARWSDEIVAAEYLPLGSPEPKA